MEIERALDILKFQKTLYTCSSKDCPCDYENICKVADISTLTYKAINLAIEVLEKQIPKKIFNHPWNGIDGVPYDLCPNCKTNLCTAGLLAQPKENYCGTCGQRLDWS